MRKLLLALIAVASLSLLGTAVVFADEGPHGGFTTTGNNEDACAGCHRTHTGYAKMLSDSTIYAMCTTCHGGSGSDTNVLTGRDESSGGALNGGQYDGATSAHDVSTETITAMPGSTKPALTRGLSCTSCHDPHGRRWDSNGNLVYNGGINPPGTVEQYRLLTGYAGPGETVRVVSNEGTTRSYTTANWKSGTSQFCTSCHDASAQGRDTGYTGVSRHPVDVTLGTYTQDIAAGWTLTTTLPLQHPTANSADDQMVCMTCHKPHGVTTAAATGEVAKMPLAPNVANGTAKTFLLRYQNNGVCQDCHKK